MGSFIAWYFAISLVGILAFPIIGRYFQRLPDRGYAFSRTAGILFLSYIFWILCSLGLIRNSLGGVLIALIILACVSVCSVRSRKKFAPYPWVRKNLRYVLAVELAFLFSFIALTWFRSNNPNILGTEKPMELMFINSILQSPTFPPHDAWLSNHGISYYYFGYVIVGVLARITGTTSAIAFNLGLATLFALAFLGAFGLAANLISRAKGSESTQESRTLSASILPSFLAPVLILIMGNFYGALEIIHDNGFLSDLKIPAIMYDYGVLREEGGIGSIIEFEDPPGLELRMINVWDWLDLKGLAFYPVSEPDGFDWRVEKWFFASRVIHDRNLIGVETEAIDEFPAFSFLLGDMHPHVLSLPFVLLAMAFAFTLLIGIKDTESLKFLSLADVKRHVGLISLVGWVYGGLAFLNFWDFPIYFFILILCYILSLAIEGHDGRVIARSTILFAGSTLVSSIVLYFPFFITFQSQAGGILPNIIYPTRVNQFLVLMGPLLLGVGMFTGWIASRKRTQTKFSYPFIIGGGLIGVLLITSILLAGISFYGMGTSVVDLHLYPLSLSEAIPLAMQKRLVTLLTTLIPALLFGFAATQIIGPFLRKREKGDRLDDGMGTNDEARVDSYPSDENSDRRSILFVCILLVSSSLLIIGPEFIYLRDNFGTRMNTLFKFYFQTWIQWGIIATFGTWLILSRARLIVRYFVIVSGSTAIILGLIYTFSSFAVIADSYNGPQTLDGMNYFAEAYPDDWAAIQWLRENAQPTDVILEGTRGAYWVEGRSSRISMATGLQTIMGWANHEAQWRGPYYSEVSGRLDDIRLVYQSRSWEETHDILAKYDVDYVVVSPLEQSWYGRIYIPKFDLNMEKVFVSGETIIFGR